MGKNPEERLVEAKFNIHKFSLKEKPDKENILIINCWSEFGCEIIGAMYCIPKIIQENPNKYYIVVGWNGRDYLYKHLVDEFWEIQEEFQFLREYSLAFHHKSRNLSKIESYLKNFGEVIPSAELAKLVVGNKCKDCNCTWAQNQNVQRCPSCKKQEIVKSLFADVTGWKKKVTRIPFPQKEVQIPENAVGITARNRKTYGRNLPVEFYQNLIILLQEMGYNPVWLGEKQTILPCPSNIPDFSQQNDLELTLAVVKQCKFTVQFWTASTRLAGIMGVPYLLFESPDQLFGIGQEAYRLSLCTFSNRKLAICHYLNVLNDQNTSLKLVKRCIEEMQEENWTDVIGLIDQPEYIAQLRKENLWRFK